MNNSNTIKLLFMFIFFVGCINFNSDSDSDSDDCDDISTCLLSRPSFGELDITLTINNENPTVDVVIYRGNYENRDTVQQFTASGTFYSIDLDFGTYSATALYKVGADSILAVDGDEISLDSETKCRETCWDVTDGKIDLTL